jgi:excisionase family DNA binding protein
MAPKTTSNTPARLINAKAAAREYGLSYSSLRNILYRGEIQVIRVGRAMYLERRDVDRWIETRKAAAV